MKIRHDVLYAPWRKEYITSNTKKDSKDPKKCVFCHPPKEDIVFETKKVFLQANKYPYGEGHLLVIPKRHITQIVELTSKEREEFFNLIDLAVYSTSILMKPQGFNIGCSIGDVAGESINHLHFHVLPRYKGDVAWSRLCDFEVLSMSPVELTEKLRHIIIKYKLAKKFNL